MVWLIVESEDIRCIRRPRSPTNPARQSSTFLPFDPEIFQNGSPSAEPGLLQHPVDGDAAPPDGRGCHDQRQRPGRSAKDVRRRLSRRGQSLWIPLVRCRRERRDAPKPPQFANASKSSKFAGAGPASAVVGRYWRPRFGRRRPSLRSVPQPGRGAALTGRRSGLHHPATFGTATLTLLSPFLF